jgi:hypothetical protein
MNTKDWKTFGEIYCKKEDKFFKLGMKWFDNPKDFAIDAIKQHPDITEMHWDWYGWGNENWTEGTMVQGDLTQCYWKKIEGRWYEIEYRMNTFENEKIKPAPYLESE